MTQQAAEPLPEMLLVFGARSMLSLLGVVLIVGGTWRADRTWDEEGTQAYYKAANKKLSSTASTSTGEAEDELNKPLTSVEVPKEYLNAAYPLPWITILGWIIFTISIFAPLGGGDGKWEASLPNFLAALFALAIGWIESAPLNDAIRFRKTELKQKINLLLLAGWIGLTVTLGLGKLGIAQIVARAVGAFFILASARILWKFRKMGESWENRGEPNPDPVVYNLGGPFFIFGWFLVWLGMSAITPVDDKITGIPIFVSTSRMFVSFVAGWGMVVVTFLADCAHDEGAEWLGFLTDGRFFGRFWESLVPGMILWFFFGLSSWLPFVGGIVSPLQWIVLLICIFLAVASSYFQISLYKRDWDWKLRWLIGYSVLLVLLAILLGIRYPIVLSISLPSALFIACGLKLLHVDRKKGDHWIQALEDNPTFTVFSYGIPLYVTGWVLLSLAMAVPM